MNVARPLRAPLSFVLRHARGVSPFGPIFGKELRTTARRKRSYWLRVLYLAGLLVAMLVAWAGTSARGYYGSISAQAQAQAELGRNFFISFCMFSVVAMAAIGPVLTSTAIGSERLGKTLHVLLMTPITAWQVVAGKLFSRLLVALTLLGLSLPALALVRLLGGVELWQMVGIVSVCAATALAAASVGLLFSVFMNRAYAVILLSYAALLFLYAFVPFVMVTAAGPRSMAWFHVLGAINPFMSAAMLAEPRAAMMIGTTWTTFVLLHLALTAVLVMVSAAAVRRVSRKAGGEAGAAGGEAGPAVGTPDPAGSTPADLPPPAPAAATTGGAPAAGRGALPYRTSDRPRTGEVSDHPVLWRELRRPLLPRRWQGILAALVAVGMLVSTYALVGWNDALDDRDTHCVYAVIFNGLLWLLTAVLAATAIAQEKESDTWTLLLTTPLGGRAIVWGKVLGLYRRLLWPGALFAAHLLIFAFADVINCAGALIAMWVMFSFNSIWVATGLYLSLRLNKATFAVIVNLLLAVLAYLGVFAVCVILAEFAHARDLPEMVGWYLPYFYLVQGIYPRWTALRGFGSATVDMPGDLRVSYEEFLLIAFAVGVAHLLFAGGILALTARAFDGIVGRARQSGAGSAPGRG